MTIRDSQTVRKWAVSVLLAAAVVSQAGCGSKQLTRAEAKQKIEPLVQKPWVIRYNGGRARFQGGRYVGRDLGPLHQIMKTQGWIEPGPFYLIDSFVLSPSGNKMANELHWECDFDSFNGNFIERCEIPTTQRIEVTVSGIQFTNDATALVDYTKVGVPSIFGQKLLDAGLHLRDTSGSGQSETAQARFQRYDDGWRVVTP